MEKYFNAHAHCFTIDHVPEHFFDELIGGKQFLRISKIKKSRTLQFLIRLGTSGFIRWVVKFFSPVTAKKLKRLRGLINYSLEPSQKDLFDRLDRFYEGANGSSDYRHVMLTMDMEYMGADSPMSLFDKQIKELTDLKKRKEYKDRVFPFIFADPRRPGIDTIVINAFKSGENIFQGIKLYPALGYYPFDKKLLEVYKFAQTHEIPIMTHCIVGDVYFRGKFWETPGNEIHPISGQSTVPITNKLFKSSKYQDASLFQLNFTHPLNWECLLNPAIASAYFGEAVDFRDLKVCIGHFGGEEEWGLHTKQEKRKTTTYKGIYQNENVLDIRQPWLGEASQRYNWLTIIKELLKEYPNVYADISFTLHEEKIYPLLKQMLQDPLINKKILFGTDYYVNATEAEENVLLETMRKNLFG